MSTSQSGQTVTKYKIHWHVMLIHLPISFYLATFTFFLVSLFVNRTCFENASFVSLVAGVLTIIPATLTGWFTWKIKYKGFQGMLFKRKIITSFIMIGISLILVIGQMVNTDFWGHNADNLWRATYFIGSALLLIGAGIEGYYGGRLNHK